MSQPGFQVEGTNDAALFTLKIHRGDGMALLAMNWRNGTPPRDFVGFAIEYREPEGDRFYAVKNRISFTDSKGNVDANTKSSRLSPFQKFRWVHFPRNAELEGEFTYKVTPVFMNKLEELSYGEPQQASLELRRDTYPDQLNVAFTRGFISSQAFVDRYCPGKKDIATLLPKKAEEGLTFTPTHPKTEEALAWMGFEARHAILQLLDDAIADPTAKVSVVAYDLSESGIVNKLKELGSRLRIIIDDEGTHSKKGSGENQAEELLVKSAGRKNVKRQHMGNLQHNKMIVADGDAVKAAVGGSTNYSWRGFFVQSNNAVIVRGENAIKPFKAAFKNYWDNEDNNVALFGGTDSAKWCDLKLDGIDAKVSFSPHSGNNALLRSIADDISETKSSLFFSLAFLYQTKGAIQDAIKKIKKDDTVFSYGLSDKEVGGLELTKPDGKVSLVSPEALQKNIPEPFKAEVTGGVGIRMHHKFVVIDFNKPTARVYTGSYNFSIAADTGNGENLWLIKDKRIAVSYVVEALAMFDHYHFRVLQAEAKKAKKKLTLAKPPAKAKDKPWWDEDYTNERKKLDRELFA